MAAYAQGRYVYAFSARAKRWSVVELPKAVWPLVSSDSIVVEYDGHIHEFSGKTGEWKYIDFRALIDAAMASEKEGAK